MGAELSLVLGDPAVNEILGGFGPVGVEEVEASFEQAGGDNLAALEDEFGFGSGGGLRLRTVTVWPWAERRRARTVPIWPRPPRMTMRMGECTLRAGRSGEGEVLLPLGRLGDLFDDGAALEQEHAHVVAEDEMLGDAAENGDGRGDAEDIGHLGAAAG